MSMYLCIFLPSPLSPMKGSVPWRLSGAQLIPLNSVSWNAPRPPAVPRDADCQGSFCLFRVYEHPGVSHAARVFPSGRKRTCRFGQKNTSPGSGTAGLPRKHRCSCAKCCRISPRRGVPICLPDNSVRDACCPAVLARIGRTLFNFSSIVSIGISLSLWIWTLSGACGPFFYPFSELSVLSLLQFPVGFWPFAPQFSRARHILRDIESLL